ncbi:MAG: hypothetical protein EOM72_06320 [Opitutae bacterium]|nr:hypothetical protein [Opitutae bacterium]
MKGPIQSKVSVGVAMVAVLLGTAWGAVAQQPVPGAGSEILRIRKMTPVKEKTPVFRTAAPGQASARQPDWWRVVVEFETAPEWIDELEFTYYAYIEDQSNKGAPVMFRGTVTYVNVSKGRHQSDMFLHPNTIARLGLVKQIAVVVKARGAVVATESTATKPNWWDGFSPVDGVLINRSQTPFAYIDYDLYEAIKPAAAAR